MKIFVTDDEKPARERLKKLISSLPECEFVGEASDGLECLSKVEEARPDAVLLDIRMPGMDGLEAARHIALLENPPAVIFTTAYDEHAIDAFNVSAIDYVLKPVRKERLAEALNKAKRITGSQLTEAVSHIPESIRGNICARVRGNLELIPISSVYFFQADQKYVAVRHKGGEVVIEEPLKSLETEFADHFMRLHRNSIASLKLFKALTKSPSGQWHAEFRDIPDTLEISRRHLPEVRKRIKDL